jgi:hypothetical protein
MSIKMIEYIRTFLRSDGTRYINLSDLEYFNLITSASEYFKKLPDEAKLKVVDDDFYTTFQRYATLTSSDEQSVSVADFIVSESEFGINIAEFDSSFYVDFVECNYLLNKLHLK